jgi:superfamily II DNA helicase RecQ
MQAHQRDKHSWINPQKKGRQRKDVSPELPWYDGVLGQHFAPRGDGSQYFAVTVYHESDDEASSPDTNNQRILQNIRDKLTAKSAAERRYIIEGNESREPNTFVARTGWASHLDGFPRDNLIALVAPPSVEEVDLVVFSTAFDWLIQTAQHIVVKQIVGEQTLYEINRKIHGTTAPRPFDSWMQDSTARRYATVFKALLFYVYRAEELDPSDRPSYELTLDQSRCLDHIKEFLFNFRSFRNQHPASDDPIEVESDQELTLMRKLSHLILDWCIALLHHPVQETEYHSPLISGLAVLGLGPDQQWLTALDFTPKYSAVIKLARIMVVYDAYRRRHRNIKMHTDQGLSLPEAKAQVESYYHLTRTSVAAFMNTPAPGQDPTPMVTIYRHLTYGLKIRYTTAADGHIAWAGPSDDEEMLYKGMRFKMTGVVAMVHGALAEARDVLYHDILFCPKSFDGPCTDEIPPIDWPNLSDDMTQSTVGYSFLDDPRNHFTATSREWFLNHVLDTPEHKKLVFYGDTVRTKFLKKFRERLDRMEELLYFLYHTCGGTPPRATEGLSNRWKNSPHGGVRNGFIEDQLYLFATLYHKGYRCTFETKLVYRYLPKEVGELFVHYIWFVIPFADALLADNSTVPTASSFLWGTAEKTDHHHWTGSKKERKERADAVATVAPSAQVLLRNAKPWNTDRVTLTFKQFGRLFLGCEGLTVASWRHIAIAMSRRHGDRDALIAEPSDAPVDPDEYLDDEEDDDYWFSKQAGHSKHISHMIYARALTENRLSKASDRQQFRRCSVAFHKLLGFRSTQVGLAPKTSAKRKSSTIESVSSETTFKKFKDLYQLDLDAQLRLLLGNEATFRPHQREILQRIACNESSLTVVLGTSAGKSLLFQLLAHWPGAGTTIVVTPLQTLQTQTVANCQKFNISAQSWSCDADLDNTRIVVVIPESVNTKAFDSYLDKQITRGRLDRIFFDECHSVFSSTNKFRSSFLSLHKLQLRCVPMIYLTATLPPTRQVQFHTIMKLPPSNILIRHPTSRPNIAYSIHYFEEIPDQDSEIISLKQLMITLQAKYPAPSKFIVYCGTRDMTEKVGHALGCLIFHANIGDKQLKIDRTTDWENGVHPIMAATTAFSLGIDQPNVRAVIHLSSSCQDQSLMAYNQEAGRGGRDGQPSEAIVLQSRSHRAIHQQRAQFRALQSVTNFNLLNYQQQKEFEQDKFNHFLIGDICRRICLDHELDGKDDRRRCDAGEEHCDICIASDRAVAHMLDQPAPPLLNDRYTIGGSSDIQPPTVTHGQREAYLRRQYVKKNGHLKQASDRIRIQTQARSLEVIHFEQQLHFWVDKCPLCFISYCYGHDIDYSHTFAACTSDIQGTVRQELPKYRAQRHGGQLIFDQFSCCHYCHTPQDFCGRWRYQQDGTSKFVPTGGSCNFPNIVAPVVVSLLYYQPRNTEFLEYIRNKLSQIDAIPNNPENTWTSTQYAQFERDSFAWMSRKIGDGGVDNTGLFHLFTVATNILKDSAQRYGR